VVARTEQEVDNALQRADVDVISVEGDKAVMAYAASQVADESIENDPELMRELQALAAESLLRHGEQFRRSHPSVGENYRPDPSYRRAHSLSWALMTVTMLGLIVALGFLIYFERKGDSSVVNTLGKVNAWAVVAGIAVVLLYSVMRQAMKTGHKVELSWQVTSVASGRLVITKVQAPRRPRR
jgi:hypothetical protein